MKKLIIQSSLNN